MDDPQRRRRGRARWFEKEDDSVLERSILAVGRARRRDESRNVADDLAAFDRYAFGGKLRRYAMPRVYQRSDEAIEMAHRARQDVVHHDQRMRSSQGLAERAIDPRILIDPILRHAIPQH